MEIRPAASIAEFMRLMSIAVGHELRDEEVERYAPLIEPERALCAYEDGQTVGAAGAHTLQLRVPGGDLPAAGVTMVGVLPTHRRRGILSALMRAQVDAMVMRGEPIACLWASDERIYGRFGFGLATLGLAIDLPTLRAVFRDDPGKSGNVRMLDEDAALGVIPPIYDRARATRPGLLARDQAWWRWRVLTYPLGVDTVPFRAVWEQEAYALYRIRDAAGGELVLDVQEAVGTTPQATREIWRFLLKMDLVDRVQAQALPLDHPLLLMLDQPWRLKPSIGDNLWVRLVDVGAALRGRARGEGSVVLDVTDPFLPQNGGRWRVGGDGVERTDSDPELALGVADLGSAYLGGFTFVELVAGGRAREIVPGAARRAEVVLGGDVEPWCPELF